MFNGKAPVFIWWHGGGFTNDNPGIRQDRTLIRKLLDRGWVVVASTYRYRALLPQQIDTFTHIDLYDVLRDGARQVQYLKANANRFGIDPDKIVASGGSAGAGLSVWLGTHDDLADPENSDPVLRHSSLVAAIIAMHPQCTYAMDKWEDYVGCRAGDRQLTGFEAWKNYYIQLYGKTGAQERIDDMNMYEHISPDDAPAILWSEESYGCADDSTKMLGNHAAGHCDVLHKEYIQNGVDAQEWYTHPDMEPRLNYPQQLLDDIIIEFLIKHVE